MPRPKKRTKSSLKNLRSRSSASSIADNDSDRGSTSSRASSIASTIRTTRSTRHVAAHVLASDRNSITNDDSHHSSVASGPSSVASKARLVRSVRQNAGIVSKVFRQTEVMRKLWLTFSSGNVSQHINASVIPEPRIILHRCDAILGNCSIVNVASISAKQHRTLQSRGRKHNFYTRDKNILPYHPEFIKVVKQYSSQIEPPVSTALAVMPKPLTRGGTRAVIPTHPTFQVPTTTTSATSSSIAASMTETASSASSSPGSSASTTRATRSTNVILHAPTTTTSSTVSSIAAGMTATATPAISPSGPSASTRQTTRSSNIIVPSDTRDNNVVTTQALAPSAEVQNTSNPTMGTVEVPVFDDSSTQLSPPFSLPGPSWADDVELARRQRDAAEEQSTELRAKKQEESARRVILLLPTLLLLNTAQWIDPTFNDTHQQHVRVLQQGYVQLFRDTTPNIRAQMVMECYPQNAVNRTLQGMEGLLVEISRGSNHVEEEHAHALEAMRLDNYNTGQQGRLAQNIRLNRPVNQEKQAFFRMVREELQTYTDFLRYWLLQGQCTEDSAPCGDENPDVAEALLWEGEGPRPVLSLAAFDALEEEIFHPEYDPTAEEIADLEDEMRAEGHDDVPDVNEIPQVAAAVPVVDGPPLQVNAADGAVHIPYVVPQNVLDYRAVVAINIGGLTRICSACSALLFPGELKGRARSSDMCCKNGQVQLPPQGRFPRYLRELLDGVHVDSSEFLNNIHHYNQVLSLAVVRSTLPLRREHLNPFIVKIGGTAYCRIPLPQGPAVVDDDDDRRSFVFYDSYYNERLERNVANYKLNPRIAGTLAEELARINPLFNSFKSLGAVLAEERREARRLGRPQNIVYLKEAEPPEDLTALQRRLYDPQTFRHEIAVLAPGGEFPDNVVVYAKHLQQGTVPVSSVHPHLSTMLFPVAFPNYQPGFRPNIARIRVAGRGPAGHYKNVTRREHGVYHLFERRNYANLHLKCRILLAYIVVTIFAQVEADRMRYIKTHQKKLSCAARQGLEDHLERVARRQGAVVDVGRIIRLPQSFEGGTACMTKRFLDGMSLVRRYGHPDYFITITCNPSWPEIQACLVGTTEGDNRPREYFYHRPEIDNRVFRLKSRAVKDLILQGKVFGPVHCMISSFEFQKKGCVHEHALLWNSAGHKVKTPEQVDAYVRATIPDEVADKKLHELVTKHMLHSACGPNIHGAKCMKDGRCSKNYPRAFRDDTVMNDGSGRVAFRRPNDGRSVIHNGHIRNNQHVVSYNPTLLRLLECHVNVDVCPSYRSLKYIFKYIFKGQDAMRVETVCTDEPERPIVIAAQEEDVAPPPQNDVAAPAAVPDAPEPYIAIDPYVPANVDALVDRRDEPVFDDEGNVAILQQDPLVQVAQEQQDEQADQQDVQNERADNPQPNQRRIWHDEASAYFNARYVGSMEAAWRLLGFPMFWSTHSVVQLAIHDEGNAPVYFDPDHPEDALERRKRSTLEALMLLNAGPHRARSSQYTYESIPEHFRFDKKERTWEPRLRFDAVIGRLVKISQTNTELYFLYLLLLHQRGYRTFQELRTVNGVFHVDYRSACDALGLLKDDTEHARAIRQASETGFGSQTRRLFAHLVKHCGVNNPAALFEELLEQLSNNYLHARQPERRARTLRQIAYYLRRMNYVAFGWPEMEELLSQDPDERDLQDCREEEEEELLQFDNHQGDLSTSLNREQRSFFDLIVDKVFNVMADDTTLPDNNLFYLNGVGGCGKTFLYRAICQHLRRNGKKFKCASFTGISALLLPEGSTLHYTFGLPMKLTTTCSSTVELHSIKATVLREAHVIIIDEISMVHKEALRVINDILKDVMGIDRPFGGKLLVVGGDFQQLLPIVTHCSSDAAALFSPCYSPLWPLFRMHHLTRNRRAAADPAFARYLAMIGSGRHPRLPGYSPHAIRIPDRCLVNKDDMVSAVFGDDVVENAADRAILTVTNADAMKLNDEIVDSLPGDAVELLSVDEPSGLPDVDLGQMPIQTINTLTPSGMPPHRLLLKPGVVVMLLRNIDICAGLANGTRLRVRRVHPAVLECEIICGERRGSVVFIPRMSLDCESAESPCPFSRYQYPVRISFAMTINKSQGQTLQKVALFLPRPPFSHAQQYVGMSRVGRFEDLKVCIPPSERQKGRRTTQQKRDEVTMTMNIVRQEIIYTATSIDTVDL